MPIDPSTDYALAFQAMLRRLAQRRPRLDLLNDYVEGRPPLPEGAAGMRASYQEFQRKARTGYPEMIVEATRERMIPVGFQTGVDSDADGDAIAWDFWSRNALDVGSADVHSDMLGMGDAYVMIGAVDEATGVPNITAEDPRQVVTRHDPTRPRVVLTGLKVFTDEWTGRDQAYLLLPGMVLVAERDTRADGSELLLDDLATWRWRSAERAPDIVPIVRFQNRRGVAEFEAHLDLLNRINLTILQRLVITAMQAYRQRALTRDAVSGATNEDAMAAEDDDGEEIDYAAIMRPGPGALWELPAGVKLWESQQTSIQDILAAVKDDVRELSAVTRTPVGYLLPDGANQSAEGAAAMREGLVLKAEDRIARARASWEQVMSIAFQFAGDEARADLARLRAIFRDPNRYTRTENADAAAKATDLPWEERVTRFWDVRPADLPRLAALRNAEALTAQAAGAGVDLTGGLA